MERKLAAVRYVDLVDSTELVATVDPEVVRRRVTRYFECVSQRIEEHGGTVEKFAGEAVMAAFGVPRAHEDDAERAVRAALAVNAMVRPVHPEMRSCRGLLRRPTNALFSAKRQALESESLRRPWCFRGEGSAVAL